MTIFLPFDRGSISDTKNLYLDSEHPSFLGSCLTRLGLLLTLSRVVSRSVVGCSSPDLPSQNGILPPLVLFSGNLH